MFERRLKIFLGIIFGISFLLISRAVQLQLKQHEIWTTKAAQILKHVEYTEPVRGRILDRHGKPMAYNAGCVDAAVDYRAIVLDEKWIEKLARERLKNRPDLQSKDISKQALADEEAQIKSDIAQMWPLLASISGQDIEQIEQVRQDIIRRVLYLRRWAWYEKYEKSGAATRPTEEAWYKRWLTGDMYDDAESQQAAALDACALDVDEQKKPQVILPNVSRDVQIKVRKAMDRCPGLQLIESVRRQYDPVAATTAEHVLGGMTAVSNSVVKNDPYYSSTDKLRHYALRDQIGEGGLERLAEPCLRGIRGENEYVAGIAKPQEVIKAVKGDDVRCTIDLDLQEATAAAFHKSFVVEERDYPAQTFVDVHGAAVVIKLDPSGNQVLAMFSNPGFDLNHLDEKFQELRLDNLNQPLLNRATQQAFPPGSSVKTIIGAEAVTHHLLSPTEGIECNGFLKTPDREHPGLNRFIVQKTHFRCWSIRFPGIPLEHLEHHQVPPQAPHRGLFGNPDGFLCLSDALERSCNVYFETVADRLRLGGVLDALGAFGLSQPTGIGIAESRGSLPKASVQGHAADELCWTAGIGEGDVTATPIQMATVAATIARQGVWMRPKLLLGDAADVAEEAERKAGRLKRPDVIDLHISKDAIDAVRQGMVNVVNKPYSGTGEEIRMDGLTVAGKTGSAQIDATELDIPVLDQNGKPVHGPDSQGHPGKGPILKKVYKPGDPRLPWLQGTGEKREHLAHAWFIGFAPAENPQIAFCVLVEYGGSGGRVAGPIAERILEACRTLHYLDATKVAVNHDPNRELLQPH